MPTSPLYLKFRTDEKCYVYDTYSNHILETPERLWDGFESALEEARRRNPDTDDATAHTSAPEEDIAQVREALGAGYLQPCHIKTMRFYDTEGMLLRRMTTRMPQLTLELTERCNSRCRYCLYTYDSDRLSQGRDMSLDTARNAVRVFLDHSVDADERTVSFWGGEPLLCESLMQSVTSEVRGLTRDRPVGIAFTTNGTLIDGRIGAFLAANEVRLLVSLDGPASVHDRHRRHVDGGSSFERVMEGLRRLKEADDSYYKSMVRFNCVVARSTDLNDVFRFFATEPLVAGHKVEYQPAAGDGTPSFDEYGGLTPQQKTLLWSAHLQAAKAGTLRPTGQMAFTLRALAPLALRSRTALEESAPVNGCCVPLLKKMHVQVNGDVYLCEQAPQSNCVGNVNEEGIDFAAAERMVADYVQGSLADCSQCWAVRLCTVCYRHSMTHRSWDAPNREAECRDRREGISARLTAYALTLESCPTAFNYLKQARVSYPV